MSKIDGKTILPYNLQLFAEVGEGTGEGSGEGANEQTQGAGEGKTYTQAELDAFLQSESDKRVSSALKKAQEKWNIDQAEKLKEAERLAKMSADDKEKELRKKQQEELDRRDKDITAKELKLEKVNIFTEKGLPVQLVDFVPGNNADEVKASIETFETSWQEAVQKAVDEKLKGKTPRAGGGGGASGDGIGATLAKQQNESMKTSRESQDLYFK